MFDLMTYPNNILPHCSPYFQNLIGGVNRRLKEGKLPKEEIRRHIQSMDLIYYYLSTKVNQSRVDGETFGSVDADSHSVVVFPHENSSTASGRPCSTARPKRARIRACRPC